MNTCSLPNIGHFSKQLAFLQTFFRSATAPLRDQPFDLEPQSDRKSNRDRNSKQIEVLRHPEQTYRLERRNFL